MHVKDWLSGAIEAFLVGVALLAGVQIVGCAAFDSRIFPIGTCSSEECIPDYETGFLCEDEPERERPY